MKLNSRQGNDSIPITTLDIHPIHKNDILYDILIYIPVHPEWRSFRPCVSIPLTFSTRARWQPPKIRV